MQPNCRRRFALAVLATLFALVNSAPAMSFDPVPPRWTFLDGMPLPRSRQLHAMAYDPVRQRVVLFGGCGESSNNLRDTWEWDGARWELRSQTGPSARFGSAMAYDAGLGGILLFGGCTGFRDSCLPVADDTWLWNGSDWQPLQLPSPVPSARGYHAMAYDASRGQVILHGGYLGDGPPTGLGDTWVFNGTRWSNVTPAVNPGLRYKHALAYNAASGRVLLFGNGNTWEWDGGTSLWTELHPATQPLEAYQPALLETPTGVLLQGTFGSNTHATYSWNGSDWEPLPSAHQPTTNPVVGAVHQASGVPVVFGGTTDVSGPPLGEMWTRTADDWTRPQFVDMPPPYARCLYVESWQRVLHFNDIHVMGWDGAAWEVLGPAATTMSPSAHLAYDAARDQVVGFGPDGTWTWNGVSWIQRQPAISPPFRIYHAMVYDAARQRVVVFGGATQPLQNDTWLWDGGNWSQGPASSAPPRHKHALAYDSDRQRVVLFGGCADWNCSSYLNDTWEWNGSTWTQMTPPASPIARAFPVMTYDASRHRVVLFGGNRGGGAALNDTWEWNGLNWEPILLDPSPAAADPVTRVYQGDPVTSADMAFDAHRGRTVLFERRKTTAIHQFETWEYGPFCDGPCGPEVCNGLDDDGDGQTDEDCNDDGDPFCGPGVVVVGAPAVCPGGAGDCNDADPLTYPGAIQNCDGVNQDCLDPTWPAIPASELDLDGDGSRTCSGDCDDADPARHPFAPDWCNGIDDDCDGVWDEGQSTWFYPDGDDDDWGSEANAAYQCEQPSGAVQRAGDCDDSNPQVHPGASDPSCNGVDENCDGEDGTGWDTDTDGIGDGCDNCPVLWNPAQGDGDVNGAGDACDNCPLAWNPAQENPDQDTVGSACDNCPLLPNYQWDFEADGIGDDCDNCPYDPNVSQSDADDDQEGDACDLDDGLIVLFRTEPDWIEWQWDVSYPSFNVYEGDLDVLRATGAYTQAPGSNGLAQRTCGVTVNFIEDADTPQPGSVQFSLVAGVAGGIEGGLGVDSSGTPRPNSAPCP